MNQSPAPALEAEKLTKRFGDFTAVDSVSFQIAPGECFGFLGPNGAGKTTTIKMLTGLARPSAGSIHMFGQDYTGRVKYAQHLMGIVPEESNLYPELDGFENLCFCASLYGMAKREREARAREMIETFGLQEAGRKKFGQYSKGMKRRLTIAAALMHRPAVLFLDEPTTGIDVASARQIRQLLGRLKDAGTTIFLTTHYIEDAERLCDRIAFIVAGRLVRVGRLEELIQETQNRHAVQFSLGSDAGGLCGPLEAAFAGISCRSTGQDLRVESHDPIDIVPFIRFFAERGISVSGARVIHPSLEDVFVRVTGIEAEEMRKEKEKRGPQG